MRLCGQNDLKRWVLRVCCPVVFGDRVPEGGSRLPVVVSGDPDATGRSVVEEEVGEVGEGPGYL